MHPVFYLDPDPDPHISLGWMCYTVFIDEDNCESGTTQYLLDFIDRVESMQNDNTQ